MTTIANGNLDQTYYPSDVEITFTPGSGGSIRFDCSSPSGAIRPTGRIIYSEETISVPAGSEVFAEAIAADATYVIEASVSSLNSGGQFGTDLLDIGDSLTEQNEFEDSTQLYRNDRGLDNWANIALGAPFETLEFAGYTGQTASYIVTQIPALLAQYPTCDVVRLLMGTNDSINGVAAATTIAAIDEACRLILGAGKILILCTVPPNTSVSGGTAAQRANHSTVNGYIVAKAMTTSGIILADLFTPIVDDTSSTSAPESGMLHDGTHFSAKGAQAAGIYGLAAALSGRVKRRVLNVEKGAAGSASNPYGNVLQNPTQSGTGGTCLDISSGDAQGTPPDNWFNMCIGSGTVVVSSSVARTDYPQKVSHRLVGSIASGGALYVFSNQVNVSAFWTPGNQARGFIELICTTLTTIAKVEVNCIVRDSGTATIYTASNLVSVDSAALAAFSGTVPIPKFTIPSGAYDVSIQVVVTPVSGGGAVDIKINDAELHQIEP